MARPRVKRCLRFKPGVKYFKPQGIPMRMLTEEILMHEEIEAIKLYEVDGLSQIEAAEKMGVSQPTFARILDKAIKKVARALVKGKALRIEI